MQERVPCQRDVVGEEDVFPVCARKLEERLPRWEAVFDVGRFDPGFRFRDVESSFAHHVAQVEFGRARPEHARSLLADGAVFLTDRVSRVVGFVFDFAAEARAVHF